MEMLTEEANPNSPPATEQPGLCMRPQVTAGPGGRGDGGSWDGAGGQLPGGQGLVAPDVPRLSTPSPTAGAPSQGPAPHSPCCAPDLSPGSGLEELLEQWEQTVKWVGWHGAREEGEEEPSMDQELPQRRNLSMWKRPREPSQQPDVGIQELSQEEDISNKVLPQGEHSIHQELSDGEARQDSELSQRGAGSDQEESQEDLERANICTILVNPKYPQPLQDPDAAPQDPAKAAASPALAEQGKAEGAQSRGPAPHSPCCSPGPSAPQPGALGEQCEGAAEGAELPGPQTVERDLAAEEEKRKQNVYQDMFWWDDTDEELSQENYSDRLLFLWELSAHREGRLHSALSPFREDKKKQESQEDWEQITIHTIWVNPKYPQLLQDPDAAPQDSAEAAASPASAEQGKAAGPQSQGPAPHSPCCSPGPSAPQPGAQALGQRPAPHRKRPSRFRRALRALRGLFRCPCLRPRPDE